MASWWGGLRWSDCVASPLSHAQDGSCSRAVTDTWATGAVRVGCAGNCWQAPAVSHDGGETWVGGGATWQAPGQLRLLRNAGRTDPLQIPSDGYAALERALSLGGDKIWELVGESGLRGRG